MQGILNLTLPHVSHFSAVPALQWDPFYCRTALNRFRAGSHFSAVMVAWRLIEPKWDPHSCIVIFRFLPISFPNYPFFSCLIHYLSYVPLFFRFLLNQFLFFNPFFFVGPFVSFCLNTLFCTSSIRIRGSYTLHTQILEQACYRWVSTASTAQRNQPCTKQ